MIEFIKHLTGVCGESHFSLLHFITFSGTFYTTYGFLKIKDWIYDKNNKK